MRKFPWRLLLLAWLTAGPSLRAADAPMAEIVVSMRYFQQTGTSHAHLYLYREDGKPLRQLTEDNAGQDRSPVFSPDGASIVFARTDDKGGKSYWSVEPHGGNLRQLPVAPDWYTATKTTALFNPLDDDPDAVRLFVADPSDKTATPSPALASPPTYRAPDGSVELVLKVSPANEEDSSDGEGHGKSYALRDLKTGQSVEMGKLPGFFGLFNLMALDKDKTRRFLLVGSLRVAFFALHLDSTDGNTTFALDLNAPRRLVRLSPNWAAPFPLPGEPAFLTWTENRYVPYGDGKHTENSSYIEHWDAGLKAVRYAKDKAAGLCGGASVYRPGQDPAVVTIRGDDP